MRNENKVSTEGEDFVVIQILDEKDTLPPNSSQRSIPTYSGKTFSGQPNDPPNDRTVARTQYYQSQNVGSQPVYHRTPESRSPGTYPTYVRRNDSNDNYQGEFIFMDSFSEQEIRNKFVKRVYSILSVQLAFTFIFTCICIFSESVGNFVKHDSTGLIFAVVLEMSILFMLICYENLRRYFPLNFILLAILTGAFSYITGALSLMYSTKVVLLSIGITAVICFTISISACQTSFDITQCAPFLCFIACISFIFISILMLFQIFLHLRAIDIIIAGVIGLIFCLYLMFDTQMIMGGRRIQLSPEEYILGALTLYIDIIQILWAIMRILGECK